MAVPTSYLTHQDYTTTLSDGSVSTIPGEEVWTVGQVRPDVGTGTTSSVADGSGATSTTVSVPDVGQGSLTSDSAQPTIPSLGDSRETSSSVSTVTSDLPPTQVPSVGSLRFTDDTTRPTTPSPSASPASDTADVASAPPAAATVATPATGARTDTSVVRGSSPITAGGPGSLGAVPSATFNRNGGSAASSGAAERGVVGPWEGSKARMVGVVVVLGVLGMGLVLL